ncbi:Stk1 family PASTA domain-containing Ser/Thr kinase [Carbonactinospora thermoautotrophica]|uniref:Stk1 family PASTA domain-containing Ser/Thr kinase n=1 Tax=Carbonactinospora thermoautotrophica TaxID=1469144 RepID=UPI00082ECBAD|nr:Stk1 family PASTA domain-containing Ser/Thr kinase [Carbonactinospora thermoautotrophica]
MDEPRRLGDRYELGALLGRGGMAEVHLGRDTRLGRTVAVKTLRADLARDPTFQARFRREAQSAASLNHPAIVAVYDTGEDKIDGNAVPYIVMEYVDGSTLRELLNSGHKLLPERALEITAGILQALSYSHRHGIVHRDIKPANVMLTNSGQVKVMDFGIARAMADSAATMTQTAAVIGTAQYLSPEQAKGEPVDARSDLYSTGCLLYELLTGRPPFIGDSPVSIAYQHVREDPVPPSTFNPEVTPEIDAIVLKSLAKNPDNRYQSADEMRADIERYLAGQPISATPVMAGATTQYLPPVGATSVLTPAGGGAPEEYPDEAPPQRRGAGYALLAIAAIAVFLGALFLTKSLFSGDGGSGVKELVIPQDIKGMEYQQAAAKLRNLGFTNVRTQQDPLGGDAEPNTVTRTNPALGSKAKSTDLVTIFYAPERTHQGVEMPDVVGEKLADAEEELRAAGFTNVKVEYGTSDEYDEGEVYEQEPPAGTEISPTDQVIIRVVRAARTTVPNVVGQDVQNAKQMLRGSDLEAEVDWGDYGCTPNTVCRQDPDAGREVKKGSKVRIYVQQPQQDQPSPSDSGGNGVFPFPPGGGNGQPDDGDQPGDGQQPGDGGGDT